MTIAISISILAAVFVFALLVSNGLPETMRWLALWLLVEARRIEERRRSRDEAIQRALNAEAR